MTEAFDYVVVGAGSAGCVLASRLSEDEDVRVLLLEAGGSDWHPLIRVPLGIGKLYQHQMYDWRYRSEPEPGLDDRRLEIPRGKVLGGSSSINVMNYCRGDRGDFDRWAANGAKGWSYTDMLPYFKKTETAEDGETETRGGSGPIGVQWTRATDPICDAWLEAARSMGYRFNPDVASGDAEGFCRGQYTIRNGHRSSAARAYLKPARRRRNLTVRTRSIVCRIVLEGKRAVGVEYSVDGRSVVVRADREVLLCGGAFNSPQVLMLSGIGPAEHLREVGIAPIVDLPVGRNLQDHLMIANSYARRSPGEFHHNMRADRMIFNMGRAWLFGTGYASTIPSGVMAFIRSEAQLDVPDVEFLMPVAPFNAHLWMPGIKAPYQDAFLIRPVLLHPESRGDVTLRSSDPTVPVRLRFNFLTATKDIETLRRGFKIGRELAHQPALDSYRAAELAPGPSIASDAEIDAYIRQVATTVCHPTSTCAMSAGPEGVLDLQLRVRGIDGLRVVDASAMPDLVSAHINACVLAMAEKAADFIRGRDGRKGDNVHDNH